MNGLSEVVETRGCQEAGFGVIGDRKIVRSFSDSRLLRRVRFLEAGGHWVELVGERFELVARSGAMRWSKLPVTELSCSRFDLAYRAHHSRASKTKLAAIAAAIPSRASATDLSIDA